jgi:ribosomal protein S18 acetylase RimI-like enzyme
MQTARATLSPLDSDRFGVVVARVTGVTEQAVPELLTFCEQHDVELLIARCDGGDLAATLALLGAGLVPLDVQIAFKGPLEPVASPIMRQAAVADRDAVAALAREGFGHYVGHYHADPRLSLELCGDGYVDWALRGLSGEAADVTFLAELDGRPAGFGMFARKDDDVEFILGAVAEAARGQGVHPALLRQGMAWGAEQGVDSMVVLTGHSNIVAQRNFVRVGLLPTASTVTFHGWRDQLGLAE